MGTKPAQRAFLFLVLSLPKCGTRGHHPPDSARIREFRTLWTEIFLLPPGLFRPLPNKPFGYLF